MNRAHAIAAAATVLTLLSGCGAAPTRPTTHLIAHAHATQSFPPPTDRLTSRELSLARSVGTSLTTGGVVLVWRGTAAQIWRATNRRERITSTTKVWLAGHELLLLICTDHPSGSGYSSFGPVPGSHPSAPVIIETSAIIDATAGRVIEFTYVPRAPNRLTVVTPTALPVLGSPTRLMV